jgi:hypothetical protein
MTKLAQAKATLTEIRDYCQNRIDNGDMDFDDWVYKSRDAAASGIAAIEELEAVNGSDETNADAEDGTGLDFDETRLTFSTVPDSS